MAKSKERSINIKVANITPKQWANLVIELNLIANAWKPFGPKIKLKTHNFDASITFYSTFRIGYLLKKLKIPMRIAPKTKLAQIYYNHKVLQNRSKSQKPEYEYNSDLVYELFNILNINDIKDMDNAPYMTYKNESIKERKKIFYIK